MAYKYIIFDMDGTLLDTREAIVSAIQKGMVNFSLKKEFNMDIFIDRWGGDILSKLIQFVEENSINFISREEITEELTRHYNRKIWDEYITPFSGIIEMLQSLKKAEIKLCVFSNSPERTVEQLIEYFFPEKFDMTIGLSNGVKKPDAAILEVLFKRYDINREQVLLVGDTLTDYLTAKNGKIDFCGVTWDDSPQVEELIKQKDVQVCKTSEELQQYILLERK